MSDVQEDHLIGRLALHYKLITQDQLAEATRQQSREGGQRKLGEILVASGALTPRRFEQLLAAQREVLAKRQTAQDPAAQPPAAPAMQAAQTMPALTVAEMPAITVATLLPATAPSA